MQHRPLVIASVVTVLMLALLVAETVRQLLAVPPKPREMECVIKRNCPAVDRFPVAPLTAPRPSDIGPLEPAKRRVE